MEKMYHYILVCAALLVSPVASFAQDGTFTASVDRAQVAMGEQIEITFTLNGGSSGGNFHPPLLNDFLVLSGPNQSSNFQFINGAMSSSISYSYVVQPKAEGKFTIGSATVEYKGKPLQTQPITIIVTEGSPQQTQRLQRGDENNANISGEIGDNLYVKVVLDKSKVYQGEQITATYKLYNRVRLANLNINKLPSFTGFWNEDVEEIKQLQFSTEVVNGKQYNVAVLRKVALFPQRSGTLQIDPMEVNCIVQVQSRRKSNNLFDQFFNDPFFGNVSNVNYKVHNDPVKITVLPLPIAGVPEGFNGAVGKFTMEAWLDRQQTKTNDPVTLRVKISGRGNLKLLQPPAVSIPPDLERYDPKISDKIERQGDFISGSRTFEYLLIPRHAGELKINAIPFAYFDVDKKSYISSKSSDFKLSVEKGSEAAYASSSGISKEDVKLLGEDIRFIKSSDISFRRKGENFAGSVGFYVLSMGPVLSFIGLFLFVKRRERIRGDVVTLRNRKARKIAQRKLVDAKKFLGQKKREEFYAEVSRALWGYVADKLAMPPVDLSIDAIRTTLLQRNVKEETVAKLASTIEKCEFARFAPSVDSHQMDAVYDETVELISTIEDEIR